MHVCILLHLTPFMKSGNRWTNGHSSIELRPGPKHEYNNAMEPFFLGKSNGTLITHTTTLMKPSIDMGFHKIIR
jgi:hypothetical protein